MSARTLTTGVECTACAGCGWQEWHDQFNPDGYRDTCQHCGGCGEEPWRPAGERDTGPKPAFDDRRPLGCWKHGDLLEVLKEFRGTHNGWYGVIRAKAMRPKVMQLAQADMLAKATMCATAAERATQAFRSAA